MLALNIRDELQKRVEQSVQYILDLVPCCTVFLFGSYATRKIKPDSDIDLLVLIEEEMSLVELRQLRIKLINEFEEKINFAYEVDIKVYSKKAFYEKAQGVNFESSIKKYMIKVGENK